MAQRERDFLERYQAARRANPGVRINVPQDVYYSEEFAQIRSDKNLGTLLKQTPKTSDASSRERQFEQDVFSSPARLQALGQVTGADVSQQENKFNPLASLGNLLNVVNPVDPIVRAMRTPEKDFLSQVGQTLKRRGRGIVKGEFIEEETGTDLLDELGLIKKGSSNETFKESQDKLSWLGRRASGLAVDVLTDPLTYVTFGLGSGLRVGSKALTKGGQQAFESLARQQATQTAEKLAQRGITRSFDEILQGTKQNLAKQTPAIGSRTESLMPFVDQGGLKFMGRTVLQPETIRNAASTIALSNAGQKVGLDKLGRGLQAVGDVVGPMFSRDYFVPKEARTFVNDYRVQRGNAISDTRDEILGVLKGSGMKSSFDKDQQLRISQAIDTRDFTGLTDDAERKTAEGFARILDRVRDEDQAAGVLALAIENYLPIRFRASRARVQAEFRKLLQKEPWRVTETVNKLDPAIPRKQLGGLRGAEKPRLTQNLQEAIDLGLDPETDPILLVSNRLLASKMARAEKEFAVNSRNLLKAGRLGDEVETALVQVPRVANRNGRRILEQKDIRVPKFVADTIDDTRKKLINSEPLNELLRGYDKALRLWKGSVTVLFPAFHVRNAMSNVVQNALDIGVASINPRTHSRAIRVLRGDGKEVLKDATGKTWTGKELQDVMKKKGLLSGTFIGEDVEKEAIRAGSQLRQLGKANPVRVMREVGSTVEEEAKAVNFIRNLERTGSVDEAANRVNRYLFDYSNLSSFEREVMRRLIPFYTFGRKNFELQLRTLLTDPKRIAAQFKAMQAFTDDISQDEFDALPDYVQESLGLKFGEDEFGRPQFITGLGLPIEEFASRLKGGESAKELLSATTPAIRFPLEIISGKDFFTGRPLNELRTFAAADILPENARKMLGIKEVEKPVYVEGEKTGTRKQYEWDPKILFAIRSLPTSRFANTLGLFAGDEKDAFEKGVRLASGIKFYSIDESSADYFKTRDLVEKNINELIAQGIIKRDEAGRPRIVVDNRTGEEVKLFDDAIYNMPFKERPSELRVIVERAERGDIRSKLMLADIMNNPDIIMEAINSEGGFFKTENVGEVPSVEEMLGALAPPAQ